MAEIKVEFNPSFQNYFECKDRWAIVWGGSGSGKSHAVAQKNVIRCLGEGKHKILSMRKVKNTLRTSVFAMIKSLCSDYGLLKDGRVKVHATDMSFTFDNGNEIILAGLDDPEKLKSIHGVTSVWLEEATEFDEADVDQVNLRLRGETDSYKQITLTFNPISADHWIYKRFFDEQYEGYIKAFTMNSNYKDNLFLDEEYINELTENYKHDPQLRRIYVEGRWGKERTGGEFYSSYNPDRNMRNVGLISGHPLHLSFDFNINPYMPATVWQIISSDGIYFCRCIKEYSLENPRNKTSEVCRQFLEDFADEANGMYYYGDATGKARTTASNRHNYDVIEDELRKYLTNSSARVPKKNPLHKKKRLFINKVLAGGYDDIRVIIDEDCSKLLADFENIQEDVDGKKWTPKGKTKGGVVYEKYGHHSDTMDYFLTEAFRNYYEDFDMK